MGDYYEVLNFDTIKAGSGFGVYDPPVDIGKIRYRLEKLAVGGEILYWYVYDELSMRQAFELVVVGYIENSE